MFVKECVCFYMCFQGTQEGNSNVLNHLLLARPPADSPKAASKRTDGHPSALSGRPHGIPRTVQSPARYITGVSMRHHTGKRSMMGAPARYRGNIDGLARAPAGGPRITVSDLGRPR